MSETSHPSRQAGALAPFRRIVIKIGSSLLIEPTDGSLRIDWLEGLCGDIGELSRDGREILVVSSGAIALGRKVLGLASGSVLRLEESQAAAAVGQITLARAYAQALDRVGLTAAQLLLTLDDTEERRRYLNARSTVATLLKFGAVPVINENDTVATSEIRYGDNDRLAARVATMVSADLLILLSDVDGLYSAPPGSSRQAALISRVERITPEIETAAGEAGSGLSRGGMRTKIEAARIATSAGTTMIIAGGHYEHPINRIAEGGLCTWFPVSANPVTARKRWIQGHLKTTGAIAVDAGAVTALRAGRSLLPAGITRIDGDFSRGDTIDIVGSDGQPIGRGLVAYDAADASRIAGRNSADIEAILGFAGRTAMIHRDDMVLRGK
jgi:glutamate 5-kinase